MAFILPVELVGAIDGVNKIFTTPGGVAYKLGSTTLWIDGQQLVRQFDDGWSEIDPSAGSIETKVAPVTDQAGNHQVVVMSFEDLLPDPAGVIEGIFASVSEPEELSVLVSEIDEIVVRIETAS